MWSTNDDVRFTSLADRIYDNQRIDTQHAIIAARRLQSQVLAGMVSRAATAGVSFVGEWMVGPVVRWYRRGRTYQELMNLDNRMLADIGISRFEIPEIVRQSHRRRGDETRTETGATLHRLAVERQPAPAKAVEERTEQSLAA